MKSYKVYLERQMRDSAFAEGYARTREELDFAASLAARREELGLTQQGLADLTGIKQPMIARIEGGQLPTPVTLRKLAGALRAVVVITPAKIILEPIFDAEAERVAVQSALIGEEYRRVFAYAFESSTQEDDAAISFIK